MDDLLSAITPPRHYVGRRSVPMAPDTTGWGIFAGPDDCYRYRLVRRWWPDQPLLLWVMMNPSMADDHVDDMTVATCCKRARQWGYGGILVGNTFAYRCTDQRRLLEVEDPIGPANDTHIMAMANEADAIILAYGVPQIPRLRHRGAVVANMLYKAGFQLSVIGRNPGGEPIPRHPLYTSLASPRIPYIPPVLP